MLEQDFLVIENLVPKGFLEALHLELYRRDHWGFSAGTVDQELQNRYAGIYDDSPMLTTTMFAADAGGIVNPLFSEVRTIFSFLEDKVNISFDEIYRSKANLTWPQPHKTLPNPPHIDIGDNRCLSMVFYVNEADGDTVIYDKKVEHGDNDLNEITRISPKPGSAVIFNSNRFHSSSPPKNSDYRIILNTVFTPKRI